MGSGAGKEKPQSDGTKPAENKIFLDEGVGIESSNISRKWTTKLSLFRNMETLRPAETPRNQSGTLLRQEQKSESEESIIYNSDESDRSPNYFSKTVTHTHRPTLDQMIVQPGLLKQFVERRSSDQDSDIEESFQAEMPRRISHKMLSDDDNENDDLTNKIKDRFSRFVFDRSDHTLDTNQDLEFLEMVDSEGVLANSFFHQQTNHRNKDKDLHLKRLYLRSRMGSDKPTAGQEKKVKFDAKQDEHFDSDYRSQDDSLVMGSQIQMPKSNLIKQREYQPQEFLAEIGVAVCCRKGNKTEGPHLNDYFIYNESHTKVIALLNSHGDYGHVVANITYRFLFKNLIRTASFYTNPKKAISKVLHQLQDHIREYFDTHKVDEQNCVLSGCVVTLVVLRDKKIFVGHLGDNRCTVYRESRPNQKKEPQELAPIDSPLQDSEKSRIFTSGGEIRKTGLEEYVYVRGRLYPQLHVTRSIGDLIGHVIGVTSLPHIKEYDILPNDAFLAVTSSSTFLYLEQEEIMNHLNGFTLRTVRQACESLYKRAKSSWLVSEGVFEDMTIILVWLGGSESK